MRIAHGAYRTKNDKNGAEYYLHRLDGKARPAQSMPPPSSMSGKSPERAQPDMLHRVYSALLVAFPLCAGHRESLRQRGLSDAAIDSNGYGTLPGPGRARIASELRERFGDELLNVPSVIIRERDNRNYVTIAGEAGLLIPCRDARGRIVALKVRRDANGDGPRYSYVSSTKHGGPGPGSPVHVPLGIQAPVEVCRVTEGELKADVAAALSGLPTISIAGVGAWRPVLDVLRQLGAKTVRLALDMDARDNQHVARALRDLATALDAEGLAVELERWPVEYKGIDDALAAGITAEVLSSDAAKIAVTKITETAGILAPIIARLDAALAEGAETLYRDKTLLADLARLAEDDPAEYAYTRAKLSGAGIRVRDFDKALAPHRQELRRQRPRPDAAGCYRVSGGRIVREQLTRDGAIEVPLANWSGSIIEETVHDDGVERRMMLAVEGALADGTPLPRAEVSAKDFGWMRWPVQSWGTRAVVLAGASTADHLRVALQLLSGDVPRRVVYEHTGWREVGGRWVYLHAGGAIGETGAVEGVEVQLPDALSRYELLAPPSDQELVKAIRASLRLLDLGPDHITVPVLGAVYRAALAESDFALYLAGPTGTYKTELATLAQQHYGSGLHARNLPGSWASTGNALEGLAFAAKDTLYVVDDFAPSGSTADVQRMHREADRLLRAQGNRSGRQRMRADGTLRSSRPPRGLILATGEDIPRGQSLRARLMVIEVSKGDLGPPPPAHNPELSARQDDAAAGLYTACMAGYLRWLAVRYTDIRAGLRQKHAELRKRALVNGAGGHARTPGIVADLTLGMGYFLDFAQAAGAISAAELDTLAGRCEAALDETGRAQAEHVEAAEPCGHFLRLLSAALASGRAHVASFDGAKPTNPSAWGWRQAEADREWEAQGRRVGWLEGDTLYLEPEAAFAEVQRLAGEQGESLPITNRTLWRRMRERGLLVSWDTSRQRNTVRRSLEGVEAREVVHLRDDVFFACIRPSNPSNRLTHQRETPAKWTVPVDDRAENLAGPSTSTVQKTGESGRNGQSGRSITVAEPTAGNPGAVRKRGTL